MTTRLNTTQNGPGMSKLNWGHIYTNINMHISPIIYIYIYIHHQYIWKYVVGVMKMVNTVPRARIKHTSLAFQASVLPLHHVGSLMSPVYPCLPVYVALCLRGQCRLLHSPPWNCKSFNVYNYIHTYIYMHRVGSTTIQGIDCTGLWS